MLCRSPLAGSRLRRRDYRLRAPVRPARRARRVRIGAGGLADREQFALGVRFWGFVSVSAVGGRGRLASRSCSSKRSTGCPTCNWPHGWRRRHRRCARRAPPQSFWLLVSEGAPPPADDLHRHRPVHPRRHRDLDAEQRHSRIQRLARTDGRVERVDARVAGRIAGERRRAPPRHARVADRCCRSRPGSSGSSRRGSRSASRCCWPSACPRSSRIDGPQLTSRLHRRRRRPRHGQPLRVVVMQQRASDLDGVGAGDPDRLLATRQVHSAVRYRPHVTCWMGCCWPACCCWRCASRSRITGPPSGTSSEWAGSCSSWQRSHCLRSSRGSFNGGSAHRETRRRAPRSCRASRGRRRRRARRHPHLRR